MSSEQYYESISTACSETLWKKSMCYHSFHENWTVGVLYLYHSHTDKVIVNSVCVCVLWNKYFPFPLEIQAINDFPSQRAIYLSDAMYM